MWLIFRIIQLLLWWLNANARLKTYFIYETKGALLVHYIFNTVTAFHNNKILKFSTQKKKFRTGDTHATNVENFFPVFHIYG